MELTEACGLDGVTTEYLYDGDQVICEYNGPGYMTRKYVYGAGIDEPIRMIVLLASADIDNDDTVDVDDLKAMAADYLLSAGFDANADLNHDGKIDNADLDILSEMWADGNGGVRDQTYYFHFDATGSVIALSDSAGDTAEIYRYDVYGAFQIYAPNGTTPLSMSVCGNPYLFTARRWDQETALYYYRARMYNPKIGRFCQTDPIGYADGINWYAYAGNNPVNWIDPFGLCETEGANSGGGFAFGYSATGGAGGGATGGAQLAVDSNGNIGIFVHGGGGGYFGVSGSGTVDVTLFTGTIYDLAGTFGTTGAGGSIPPFAGGVEYFVGSSNHGINIQGGVGAGIPIEMHGFMETGTIIGGENVPEVVHAALDYASRNSGMTRRIHETIGEWGLD